MGISKLALVLSEGPEELLSGMMIPYEDITGTSFETVYTGGIEIWPGCVNTGTHLVSTVANGGPALWITVAKGLVQPGDLTSHLLLGTGGCILPGFSSASDKWRQGRGLGQ